MQLRLPAFLDRESEWRLQRQAVQIPFGFPNRPAHRRDRVVEFYCYGKGVHQFLRRKKVENVPAIPPTNQWRRRSATGDFHQATFSRQTPKAAAARKSPRD